MTTGDDAFRFINSISLTGTSPTLREAHNGKTITMNNASSITLTVPAGLSLNFTCTLVQLGAGQVTISAGSGVTLRSYNSQLKLTGQYAVGGLYGYDTDTFVVGGNTVA